MVFGPVRVSANGLPIRFSMAVNEVRPVAAPLSKLRVTAVG